MPIPKKVCALEEPVAGQNLVEAASTFNKCRIVSDAKQQRSITGCRSGSKPLNPF
ncbi:MAG: hypothetical protein WBE73_19195 [Candidatus Acidiferrum sp.]